MELPQLESQLKWCPRGKCHSLVRRTHDLAQWLVEGEFVLDDGFDGSSGDVGVDDDGDGALFDTVVGQHAAGRAAASAATDDQVRVGEGVAGAEVPVGVAVQASLHRWLLTVGQGTITAVGGYRRSKLGATVLKLILEPNCCRTTGSAQVPVIGVYTCRESIAEVKIIA